MNRKSRSGILLMLGGNSVSWTSLKQRVVGLSTSEAEFISASEVTKKILWIRHLLKELGIDQRQSTNLLQDNQGTINWSNFGIRNAKHVAIRGNFVRDHIEKGHIAVQYCPTTTMVADILTKPLERTIFERHRQALCVLPSN